MKKIYFWLILFSGFAFAQTPNLSTIPNFEGKTITLCEKVTGTHKTRGNTTFINFGKLYPNQAFTVVIFDKDLVRFSYIPVEFLKNKKICVTGKVIKYQDQYEIIISREEDIIIEE